MNTKIPKYNFNNPRHVAFEITTLQSIYRKSKSKLHLPHRQGFYALFYFTNTYGKHIIDFKTYDIKKGSLFLISDEQVHYFRNIEKTTGKVVLFTNAFLDNDVLIEQLFNRQINLPVLSLRPEVDSELQILLNQLEKNYTSDKENKNDIIKRYLEILLLEINHNSEGNTLLNTIDYQRFIKFKNDLKHYFAHEKSVRFYAENQLISTKTLNLAVRKMIDKSAKQLIDEYRVLLAKRLLANTHLTTAQISFQLGFDEPTNFTKFFKRVEGLSPIRFQKGLKNTVL